MRTIVGAVETDGSEYRYRMNHEIKELLDGETTRIVGIIKAQRVKWLGYVWW